MRRFEITDEQFARIQLLLPGKKSDPGCTAADNRLFVQAVLWLVRTGVPWRDLPERFGKWNSVFQRFNRWAKNGVWTKIFESLHEPDWEWVMIDATIIRAHQHAAGAKKNAARRDNPFRHRRPDPRNDLRDSHRNPDAVVDGSDSRCENA